MKRIIEFPLVIIVCLFIVTILAISIILDALHWLFWHTIGSVWITLQVRWLLKDLGNPSKLQMCKWMILGRQ